LSRYLDEKFLIFAASARTRGMANVAKVFEIITKAVQNIRQSRSKKNWMAGE
jgi:rubrerythrin